MKYKVGDKVRIRKDLVLGSKYSGKYGISDDMILHRGEIAMIDLVGSDYYYLNIDGDRDYYAWTDEMLEEVDEMKYKVGDKVRVRKDLEVNETYGGETFVDTMEKFKGKVVEIEDIRGKGFYTIKGDLYTWSDEMFEDAERYIIIAEDGNEVIAKMDGKLGIAKCSPDVDTYDNTSFNERMIKRGLVFKTKEEAIAVAKKMLAVLIVGVYNQKESDSNDE